MVQRPSSCLQLPPSSLSRGDRRHCFCLDLRMANILWDDSRVTSEGGGTWTIAIEDRFFGGSARWPAFATNSNGGDSGQYGSLSVTFHGVGINFHGNTPAPPATQNCLVSVDGGSQSQASYGDSSPPTSLQWYQSSQLSDSQHSINISRIAGTSVDYMVIAAGQNTPLGGETLIVDDGDSDITYSGSWTRNTNRYTSRDNPHAGVPHGGAVHQTGTTGSTATFVFSGKIFSTIYASSPPDNCEGNNVALYSVYDFSHIGWITVKYTIDGNSQTITHAVSSSTSQYTSGVLQQENTLLWKSSSSLSLGDHQLTIEIVDSDGQTDYVLDYILYNPSFETLAAKPNLSPTQVSSSNSPTSTSGSGSSGGSGSSNTGGVAGATSGSGTTTGKGATSGTGTVSFITITSGTVQTVVPAVSTSGSNSGNSNADSSTSQTTKSTPVGAIAGGVVAGVAVILLLIALLLCRKRLSKRAPPPREEDAAVSDVVSNDNFLYADPFTEAEPVSISDIKYPTMSRNTTPTFPDTRYSTAPTTWSRSAPRSETYSDHDNAQSVTSGRDTLTTAPTTPHKSEFDFAPYPTTLSPLRREVITTEESTSQVGTTSPISKSTMSQINTASPVTTATVEGGGAFRTKMQRLQELVTDLNNEIAVDGENSVKVAELRGRIAELTREEAGASVPVPPPPPPASRPDFIRESTMTVPPPYEPRRD
ncbi:hypothetical protein H0H93_004389 [Arthromyces matolae]|nr:hypothetical protein H0H93_004389 [Arthromyces matolae]